MNGADWIIVAVLSASGLLSLWRGFVKEAISLVVWIAAFGIGIAFSPKLSVLLADSIDSLENDSLRLILAFILLFIGTLIVGGLINRVLASLLKVAGLSGTDRLLGMVFGFFRGAIVVLACLIIVPPLVAVDEESWWRESVLIPRFLMLEDWALQAFSDVSEWRHDVIGL
ncbi:MAG: CvpA family protein [Pseudomonadales bacterium]|nr:CvpA family protein [Pseudomonadales bacterium]